MNDLKQLKPDNLHTEQKLLLSLLITCCDLNDQIKGWPTVHRVAVSWMLCTSQISILNFPPLQELVYTEFFAQGDLERQMGLHPNLMMDRQKACVPALQIEFLDTVVTPTFEILLNIFPESSKFLETIETNKQHWEDLKTNVIKA